MFSCKTHLLRQSDCDGVVYLFSSPPFCGEICLFLLFAVEAWLLVIHLPPPWINAKKTFWATVLQNIFSQLQSCLLPTVTATCPPLNPPLCMGNYELLFPSFDPVVRLPPECLVWLPDHPPVEQGPGWTVKDKAGRKQGWIKRGKNIKKFSMGNKRVSANTICEMLLPLLNVKIWTHFWNRNSLFKKNTCFVLVLVQKLLTENGTLNSYIKA